MKYQTLGRGRM